jgi:trehalose-6-phosphatase
LEVCPGSDGCKKPAVGEQDPAAKVGVDEGEPLTPGGTKNPRDFGSKEKLDTHFKKHGDEFGAKNAGDYLSIARQIINEGIKVKYSYEHELRTGFVMFLGNNKKMKPKFAFVGTNNKGEITTAHVKTDKDFWKTINGNAKDRTIRPHE